MLGRPAGSRRGDAGPAPPEGPQAVIVAEGVPALGVAPGLISAAIGVARLVLPGGDRIILRPGLQLGVGTLGGEPVRAERRIRGRADAARVALTLARLGRRNARPLAE